MLMSTVLSMTECVIKYIVMMMPERYTEEVPISFDCEHVGHFPQVWLKNELIEDGNWEHQLMVMGDTVNEFQQQQVKDGLDKMSAAEVDLEHTVVKIGPSNIILQEHTDDPNDDWFIIGEADSPISLSPEWNCLKSDHPIIRPEIPTKTSLLKCVASRNCSSIAKHKVYNAPKPKMIKTFRCSKCKKKFTTRVCFMRHKRTHIKEKYFKCDNCRKSFVHYRSLLRHLQIHRVKNVYKCSVCCKVFSLRCELLKHVVIHTEGESVKYTNDIYTKVQLQGYYNDHDYHLKLRIDEDKVRVQTPTYSGGEDIDVESVDNDLFLRSEMLLVDLDLTSSEQMQCSSSPTEKVSSDPAADTVVNRRAVWQTHAEPTLDSVCTKSNPYRKRIFHNTKERLRRMNIRELVEGLRILLPKLKNNAQVSMLMVLSEAAQYCRELQMQTHRRIAYVAQLERMNKRLNIQLSQLRSFLTSMNN